ncbi:MAG: Fic/DOC family N-terminal domain-containing protein, partial [Verrucomicrobiota bacterium]
MASILPLHLPLDLSLESSAIWRALRDSHRSLAELKGLCMSLPNPSILIETLSLQEAKDSSAI